MKRPSTDISAEQPFEKIGLLGFGEAGQAIASGWAQAGRAWDLRGFDLKTDSPDSSVSQAKWQDYTAFGVTGAGTIDAALKDTPLAISLVTADQAHTAARAAAQVLPKGAVFLDCNSCSPGTKQRSAEVLEQAGCTYIDCAIMSPIHPKKHEAPMLISGPRAADVLAPLMGLFPEMRLVGNSVGRASAIKMLRSVMMKGMEALVLEGFVAARKAGVEDDVIASLQATFPGLDWRQKAAYDLERTTTHGLRRSAEMREVVQTLTELGTPNDMSRAIADWQFKAGALGLSLQDKDFANGADALLAAMEETA